MLIVLVEYLYERCMPYYINNRYYFIYFININVHVIRRFLVLKISKHDIYIYKNIYSQSPLKILYFDTTFNVDRKYVFF